MTVLNIIMAVDWKLDLTGTRSEPKVRLQLVNVK